MGHYAGVVTITLHYVHSRVHYNTFTNGKPNVRVDLYPMPDSTLSPSQGLWIWPLPAFTSTQYSTQRVLNDLKRTRLSRCRMIWLLPLFRHWRPTGELRKRYNLLTGKEGKGMGEAKLYGGDRNPGPL